MKLIKIDSKAKDGKVFSLAKPLPVTNTKGQISLSNNDFVEDNKKLSPLVNKEIQDKSIKTYNAQKFKKILKKKNIWAFYKFSKSDWDILVQDKTRYEGFVCGYLAYYDSEVRNGMSDHGVFFHWGQWNKDPYCCVIFLDPAPVTKELKYSNSTDRFGKKYFGQIVDVDSPLFIASDPPKVPPPPPPY